jgi:signal peptidase I
MKNEESVLEYFEEDESKDEEKKPGSLATILLTVFDFFKTIFIIVVLATVIRYFLIQPFIVDGQSMEPTFQNSDYLITEKVSFRLGTPKRGEVVIFHPPDNPSVNYLKRLIGLPGDEIEIKDKLVYVNGKKLDEPYLTGGKKTELVQPGNLKVTVKANEYFVLGDNREHSRDSRELGPIPKANVVSRVWVRLFPLSGIKTFSPITYN